MPMGGITVELFDVVTSRTADSAHNVVVTMETQACHHEANEIAYLEHVVLEMTLTDIQRSGISIYLTSPSGTVSKILERRYVLYSTCICNYVIDYYCDYPKLQRL